MTWLGRMCYKTGLSLGRSANSGPLIPVISQFRFRPGRYLSSGPGPGRYLSAMTSKPFLLPKTRDGTCVRWPLISVPSPSPCPLFGGTSLVGVIVVSVGSPWRPSRANWGGVAELLVHIIPADASVWGGEVRRGVLDTPIAVRGKYLSDGGCTNFAFGSRCFELVVVTLPDSTTAVGVFSVSGSPPLPPERFRVPAAFDFEHGLDRSYSRDPARQPHRRPFSLKCGKTEQKDQQAIRAVACSFSFGGLAVIFVFLTSGPRNTQT